MLRVYLELGEKKVFACALDWAGWCRAGKTDELAIEALTEYAPRYEVIAAKAGLELAAGKVSVVEKVRGDATTDFGAPGAVPDADGKRSTRKTAERQVALMQAAWDVFDKVAVKSPAELRKGLRGGGRDRDRDRDKMIAHLVDAERAYARKIGVKHPPFELDDTKALAAMRAEIVEVLSAPSDGSPLTEKGWPARYAVRRFAWHVIDHLWEMEDRRTP